MSPTAAVPPRHGSYIVSPLASRRKENTRVAPGFTAAPRFPIKHAVNFPSLLSLLFFFLRVLLAPFFFLCFLSHTLFSSFPFSVFIPLSSRNPLRVPRVPARRCTPGARPYDFLFRVVFNFLLLSSERLRETPYLCMSETRISPARFISQDNTSWYISVGRFPASARTVASRDDPPETIPRRISPTLLYSNFVIRFPLNFHAANAFRASRITARDPLQRRT